MKFVRITAAYIAAGRPDPVYRYVFLCGVGEDGKVLPQHEWFGYCAEGRVRYPFTLSEEGGIDYGWQDNSRGRTSLREVTVAVGSSFTVTHPGEAPGASTVETYKITHCVDYEELAVPA